MYFLGSLVEDLQNKVNQSNISQSLGNNCTSKSNLTIPPGQFYKKDNDSYCGYQSYTNLRQYGIPPNDRSQLQGSRYMQDQQQKLFHPKDGDKHGIPSNDRSQLQDSRYMQDQQQKLFHPKDGDRHGIPPNDRSQLQASRYMQEQQQKLFDPKDGNRYGIPPNDRSQLQASRYMQDQQQKLFHPKDGGRHQRFSIGSPTINRSQIRMNESHCNSVLSQLPESSIYKNQFMCNPVNSSFYSQGNMMNKNSRSHNIRDNNLLNKITNTQCSIIGSTVENDSVVSNNRAKRINDAQESSFSQQILGGNFNNNQSEFNLNNKTSDVRGQHNLDFHHFRKPYDVQIQLAAQHGLVSRVDQTQFSNHLRLQSSQSSSTENSVTSHYNNTNIIIRPTMTVSSNSSIIQEVNDELSAVMSVINSLPADKRVLEKAGTLVKQLRTFQNDILSLSNNTSVPALPHEELQSIPPAIETNCSTQKAIEFPPQPNTGNVAAIQNTEKHQKGKSRLRSMTSPAMNLRSKKKNSPKKRTEEVELPLSVQNENSKHRCLSNSSQNATKVKAITTKTLNKCSDNTQISSENLNNNKSTKRNRKSDSKDKENIENGRKIKLVSNRKNKEETSFLEGGKTKEKTSVKNVEKPRQNLKKRDVLNEISLEELDPKKDCAQSQEKNTYVSSRGRVVKPTTQYWLKKQSEQNGTSEKNDVLQVESTSNKSNISKQERKRNAEKAEKERLKNPVVKNKKPEPVMPDSSQNVKQDRSKATVKKASTVCSNKISNNNPKKNNKSPLTLKCIEKETKTKSDSKEKNNKKLPVKESKKVEKLQTKEAKKPVNSKGKKRKNDQQDESVLAKKKKKDTEYKISNGYPFDSSLKLFETQGSSGFCFGAPSPGEALNSIRKKAEHTSGRETPPTKYLCSFLDHTGNTKSPSVMSGDEHNNPVTSHAANRVTKKMEKAKNSKKQVKQKKTSKVEENENPAVTELLNQVLHGKGKTPKKVEEVFRTKLTLNVHGEDSFDSWGVESEYDSDNYEDLK